jgi:hypothetical protein
MPAAFDVSLFFERVHRGLVAGKLIVDAHSPNRLDLRAASIVAVSGFKALRDIQRFTPRNLQAESPRSSVMNEHTLASDLAARPHHGRFLLEDIILIRVVQGV